MNSSNLLLPANFIIQNETKIIEYKLEALIFIQIVFDYFKLRSK